MLSFIALMRANHYAERKEAKERARRGGEEEPGEGNPTFPPPFSSACQ